MKTMNPPDIKAEYEAAKKVLEAGYGIEEENTEWASGASRRYYRGDPFEEVSERDFAEAKALIAKIRAAAPNIKITYESVDEWATITVYNKERAPKPTITMPEKTRHIGDGVYATFDGYGMEIRVNDHRNEVAVYLEPDVLNSLVRFAQAHYEAGASKPSLEASLASAAAAETPEPN